MKPPGLKEIEAILQARRDELEREYGVAEIGFAYVNLSVRIDDFIYDLRHKYQHQSAE